MDRIDLTKKRKNLNTMRSIKVRERIGKIKYQIEGLNGDKAELGYDDILELVYRGKHHRLCLLYKGSVVAFGLNAIEEFLWELRYLKTYGETFS